MAKPRIGLAHYCYDKDETNDVKGSSVYDAALLHKSQHGKLPSVGGGDWCGQMIAYVKPDPDD